MVDRDKPLRERKVSSQKQLKEQNFRIMTVRREIQNQFGMNPSKETV